MDDYENDDSKLEHIPFELYHTEVGYGPANARVDIKLLGLRVMWNMARFLMNYSFA